MHTLWKNQGIFVRYNTIKALDFELGIFAEVLLEQYMLIKAQGNWRNDFVPLSEKTLNRTIPFPKQETYLSRLKELGVLDLFYDKGDKRWIRMCSDEDFETKIWENHENENKSRLKRRVTYATSTNR